MYAIIDIEATGGSPKRDKITEVAIYRYDGEKVVDTFSTLINPEIEIPPFISRLTGITDDMVAEAPKFEEVAERILELTKDAVFVAHNVQFDYSYMKAEFKRLGHEFERKKLCTVILSKQILPDVESYSLGNICQELGIPIENRHRAKGDAKATVELFKLLVDKDEFNCIYDNIHDVDLYKNLPPNLEGKVLATLPEETGVYYFHNAIGKVIFVGKSVDIRRRVYQHIINNISTKGKRWQMLVKTHNISFQETGSELIAQLLESYEIKRLRPNYNKAQRARRFNYGIFKYQEEDGYLQIEVRKLKSGERPIAAFSKEEYALKILKARMEQYKLCPHFCGVKGKGKSKKTKEGACENVKRSLCNGACLGKEKVAAYNRRARKAFKDLEYPASNLFIIGEGRVYPNKSVVYVEDSTLVGWGYFEADFIKEENYELIKEKIIQMPYNYDADKLVRTYIDKNKLDEIIKLGNVNQVPVNSGP